MLKGPSQLHHVWITSFQPWARGSIYFTLFAPAPPGYLVVTRGAAGAVPVELRHSSADTSLCSPSGGSVGTPPPPKVWSSPIGSVPVVTSHTAVIPGETVCHGNPSRKPPEWQAAVYLWVQGPCSFTVSIPWPRGHRSRPPQLMRAPGPGHRLSQAG